MGKYTDKDTVKSYLGVDFTTTVEPFVGSVIESIDTYIERYCGDEKFGLRIFKDPGADETRYFDGNDSTKLPIGDVLSLTSIEVENQSLTEDQDYYLYPLNADKSGQPFTWVELVQPETGFRSNLRTGGTSYFFELGQRNVAVTGRFAYSTTPPADVQLAAVKLVAGVLKENIGDKDIKELKSESLGAYSVSYESVSQLAYALEVEQILAPYRRNRKEKGSVTAGLRKI